MSWTIARRKSFSNASGWTAASPDARGSGKEIRCNTRAHSAVAEHCALEAPPRAEQERAPGRCRIAGRSLGRRDKIDILHLKHADETSARLISPSAVAPNR